MKKALSIILAALMLTSTVALTSCSSEDANETEQNNTVEEQTPAEEEDNKEAEEEQPSENAQEEEKEAEADAEEEQPAEEEDEPEVTTPVVEEEEEDNTGLLFDQMDTWHYATYNCVFYDNNGDIGGYSLGENAYYEDDEMADFIADNPEWYKDTALMGQWDEAEAPFGDCINSMLAADTDFVLDPTNCNGLMTYKTFTIDELGENDLYEMYCFYDNTVYIYVNGELYYSHDCQLGANGSSDWNSSYALINCSDPDKTLKDFLHEGENYVAVSIKNAFGGREFDMYIEYEKDSTKDSVRYFDRGSEWHYTVLACPYTDGEGTAEGSVAGGYFDEATDEMAKFIADNPNFMTDTALLETWPTEKGPFGSSATMEATGWTGSNHGLILYKTFTVDDLAKATACDDFVWDCAYDNAIHVYLNGTEVYTDDGECVSADWADGQFTLDHDLVSSLLVEGENYFVVTIKDAWGGRNFDAGFSAEWY